MLKNLVSVIVSCLVDENIFGHYQVEKLFMTGSVLSIIEHNEMYHHIITTEIEKEFKQQIRETLYPTKLIMIVDTSIHRMVILKNLLTKNIKSFCFDLLLKGDLRAVHSATFCLGKSPGIGPYCVVENLASNRRCYFLTIRGTELVDQTLHTKIMSDDASRGFTLCKEFYALCMII